MECIDPGTITAEDLQAFADSEAQQAVVAHVQRCPACAATAARYAREMRQLVGVLYRFNCPGTQALGDYELGRLAPAERTAIAAHVVGCALCRAELAQLREFLRLELPAPAVGNLARVRRVAATLLAPAPGRAAVGVRGADDGTRTYTAAGLTIAVEVAWAARRQRGTITALLSVIDETTPLAGWSATLYDADNTHIATIAVDDVGTFGYDAVAAGTYRVELTQGDRAVSIEDINVGPDGPA